MPRLVYNKLYIILIAKVLDDSEKPFQKVSIRTIQKQGKNEVVVSNTKIRRRKRLRLENYTFKLNKQTENKLGMDLTVNRSNPKIDVTQKDIKKGK